MFVMVWCRRLSPNFSLTMLCRNLPSYCGPVKLLISFPAEANGDLLPKSIQLVSRHLKEEKKSFKALDILYLTHCYGIHIWDYYPSWGKILGQFSRQKSLMSLAANKGRFCSLGAVSIAVTRPPVLVPEITSKQSASLASTPSRFYNLNSKTYQSVIGDEITEYIFYTWRK